MKTDKIYIDAKHIVLKNNAGKERWLLVNPSRKFEDLKLDDINEWTFDCEFKFKLELNKFNNDGSLSKFDRNYTDWASEAVDKLRKK